MTHKLNTKELECLEVKGIGEVRPGMVLVHPIFGVGKVEAIFEFIKSGESTIRIAFEKHGSKALVPEHAKLSLPKEKSSGSLFGKLFKR